MAGEGLRGEGTEKLGGAGEAILAAILAPSPAPRGPHMFQPRGRDGGGGAEGP